MGILFLPGTASQTAHVEASTTPQTAAAQAEDPSPRKVATRQEHVTASYTVHLTGYNAVPEQTDGDPSTTASGVHSNAEVIAARSQDLAEELPFGTVVKITRAASDTPGCKFHRIENQIGYRVIADTMHYRWEKRVDVQLDPADKVKIEGKLVNPGIALGVCGQVKVEVVGHLPLSRIPATQAELAKIYAPRELALNT
jgi:3D (Asp-Asp-Asp) domain-containing protein